MDVFIVVLQTLTAVGLPFLVGKIAGGVLHLVANKEFSAVPILGMLARLAGFAIGGLLLYADLDVSYFDLEMLFIPESRWNLTFSQFILERGNIFAYHPGPLVVALRSDPPLGLLAASFLAVASSAGAVISCLRLWPGRDGWRAIVACGATMAWTAWATVYFSCLTFWLLFKLNFWALALFALYYQYRRAHD